MKKQDIFEMILVFVAASLTATIFAAIFYEAVK